ncbi:DNA polymerase sigma [Trypanosoma grayi]|uniref:DNA polymerase sigma n=1 Tax=Trypanosoma grayi TaxID=71804 RepID=UPI0004F43AB8|nr:DNA polymerase sigma [Trypanosoma grayi]KEG12193.1 DNA polymerase sigma [Trypanosoma grayi]
MGRRAHVVSRRSVVAANGSPTAAKEEENCGEGGSSGAMADIPAPAPALSLFSRFQQRSNDFTGDWMMMQDAEVPSVPPISSDLAQKLREHQDVMQKQRDGAAATAAEGRAATPTTTTTAGGEGGNTSEDDEYDPNEVADTSTVQQKQPSDGQGEDGIQGDFLSLLSTKETRGDVAKSDLQATLTVLEGRCAVDSPKKSSLYENNKQERQKGALQPSSSSHQRVVPLWSVERFTTRNGYSRNPIIALHQEICDFVDYLRPSQVEMSMRRIIEMEVSAIAKRLWPECEPIVYGSMSTQLLLPLSDLDMSILNVPVSVEEALATLAREISSEGLCHTAYPQLILKTKVPLVKFQHRLSLLDVDISINAADGQRNSAIVVDMLSKYPEARTLTVVVKYFLQQRGMHEPYHGGLGSFATTLLVISFLQHHPIYTDHTEERAYSGLGRLLVDFFRYYGLCFRYNRCGISLLDGGRYFRRTDASMFSPMQASGPRSPLGPPQVLVEDPGCPQNNAASSLRNFHVITSLFAHAYMTLTAVFDPPAGGSQAYSPDAVEIARRPTLLSRILHVDAPSVGRRQSIAAAYEALLQDPAQREKVQAVAATFRSEEDKRGRKGTQKPDVPAAGAAAAAAMAESRKRHRRNTPASTKSSNSSSSSSNSSNSSSSSSRKKGGSGTMPSHDGACCVKGGRPRG